MNTGRLPLAGKYEVPGQEGEPSLLADRRTSRVGSLGFGSATEGLDGEVGAIRRDGLDWRVVELLESACKVLAGQGRLWNLLRPGRDATADMDLAELLPAVVGVARELTEAGCAGLGVRVSGEPFRFLADQPGAGAPRAGCPPGVASLGERLVAEGRLIRQWYRPGQPVLDGPPKDRDRERPFLGVPLPSGGQVSGYLYVADKRGGADFTGDDEELLVALASAAASSLNGSVPADEVAIPPAISAEAPAAADAGAVLGALAQTVMRLADGDAAVVVQPVRSGSLRVVAAAGQRWAHLADQVVPVDGTLSGLAINCRRAVVVPDAGTKRAVGRGRLALAQPVVAAPLFNGDRLGGALTVSRPEQAEPFSRSDISIISELAAHSGLLLNLVEVNPLDGPRVAAEDPAPLPEALKADLEQRLVLYAATTHTLACRVLRGRIVRELLEQAEQLHLHLAETVVALSRTGFGATPGTADVEDGQGPEDTQDAEDTQGAPSRP
jgi:GAF domain-containing protein